MANSFTTVTTVATVVNAEVPQAVRNLAAMLAAKHGDAHIAKETGGWHIYMASPACLEQDGLRELGKRHLSVNADKYFGIGTWKARAGTYDNDNTGLCMKTGTAYRVSDLLRMVPLTQRGYTNNSCKVSVGSDNSRFLVDDGNGNMIPEAPGDVIPVDALPTAHPAAQYLLRRGFDLGELHDMFETSYCYAELPESRELGRYWRSLPGGFKDTPQGRIIFYALINGVRRGWQARLLSYEDGDNEWAWHPYDKEWVCVRTRIPGGEWEPTTRFSGGVFDPSKYRISRGGSRNSLLLGYDAAVAWNARRGSRPYACVLVEGPLDAGKLGSPAVAMMGKFLSDDQAALISRTFDKVLFVMDNDKAGREGATRIRSKLSTKHIVQVSIPDCYKDAGEMPIEEARRLIYEHL